MCSMFSFFFSSKIVSSFFQFCFIASTGIRVYCRCFPPWSVLHGDEVSDTGRDSWDWVGLPTWEGMSSSPDETEPPQIGLLCVVYWCCCRCCLLLSVVVFRLVVLSCCRVVMLSCRRVVVLSSSSSSSSDSENGQLRVTPLSLFSFFHVFHVFFF